MTDVTLRPAAPEDEPFLRRVYASTRADELAQVPWSDEMKRRFCDMQFDAQDADYRARWRDMRYDVILVGGEPAGRLWQAFSPSNVHVLDLAILPEFRGRGAGTKLLRDVIAHATSTGRSTSISVEKLNRARALYERLGFRVVSESDVHYRMERSVSAS